MLYWHKFNFEKSLEDLSHFTPLPGKAQIVSLLYQISLIYLFIVSLLYLAKGRQNPTVFDFLDTRFLSLTRWSDTLIFFPNFTMLFLTPVFYYSQMSGVWRIKLSLNNLSILMGSISQKLDPRYAKLGSYKTNILCCQTEWSFPAAKKFEINQSVLKFRKLSCL